MRPVKDVSGHIPDKLKMAIGDAVSLFSKIDHCALEIVWLITGADLVPRHSDFDSLKSILAKNRPNPLGTAVPAIAASAPFGSTGQNHCDEVLVAKRKLAKAHAIDNLKTFEDAIRELPEAESDAIWVACRELRRQRNLIAHGVWMVDDAGIPHVTWHSHFLESDDYAVVQSFGYEDFDSFLESARAVLNAFDETKRDLEELLPGKWPAIADMKVGGGEPQLGHGGSEHRSRTMHDPTDALFSALDPFFDIVMRGLAGLVDGDHYFDTIAPNAVFEFRYRFPDYPTRVVGREALMSLYAGYGKNMTLNGAGALVVNISQTPGVVILEYEVQGNAVRSGKLYENRFISVVTIEDRKIVGWRDYMDSLAAMSALT